MRTWDRTPRRAYQLCDILTALVNAEFNLEITVDGDTLFSSGQVYIEMAKYSNFFFSPVIIYVTHTNDFVELWKEYIAVNGENLKRTYDALYSDYNPIENYSLHESGIDGVKRDKVKTETTPTGKTINTDTLKQTGLETIGAGSITDERTSESEFENRKDTNETTYTNTQSAVFEDETHSGYHEAREHFFTRKGNIGTMTAMDMIQSEEKGRKNALLEDFVKRFIFKHCFYTS